MSVGPLASSRVMASMVHYDALEVGAPDYRGVASVALSRCPVGRAPKARDDMPPSDEQRESEIG